MTAGASTVSNLVAAAIARASGIHTWQSFEKT
jgi:hypothetical protein